MVRSRRTASPLADLHHAAGADSHRHLPELVVEAALALAADDRLELAAAVVEDCVDERSDFVVVVHADDPGAREQSGLAHLVRRLADHDDHGIWGAVAHEVAPLVAILRA